MPFKTLSLQVFPLIQLFLFISSDKNRHPFSSTCIPDVYKFHFLENACRLSATEIMQAIK
jgi:hypothetical protein